MQVVTEQNKTIPLQKMCMRSKHEKLLLDQIMAKFSKWKSIRHECHKLDTMNDKMRFKGTPLDKSYVKKCGAFHLIKNREKKTDKKKTLIDPETVN